LHSEEARTFFGLPDLKPMQAELLDQLKDRLRKSMQALGPEAMARKWFSPMEMLEKMQDMFLGDEVAAEVGPKRRGPAPGSKAATNQAQRIATASRTGTACGLRGVRTSSAPPRARRA